MKLLLVAFGIAFAFASCTPETTVPVGPGTEYPCGTHGKMCPNKLCCGEDWDCADYAGCPPETCCFAGDSTLTGASKKKTTPAWKPTK